MKNVYEALATDEKPYFKKIKDCYDRHVDCQNITLAINRKNF